MNSPPVTELWLDKFLFVDALIVSIFLCIDWLIGEQNRQKMRDAMGVYWLHLNEFKYYDIYTRSLVYAEKILKALYVKKNRKIFFLRIFLISNLAIFIAIAYFPFLYLEDNNWTEFIRYEVLMIGYLITNPIGFLLSYKATMFFLQKMIEARSLILPVKYFLLDIFIACTIWTLVLSLPLVITQYFGEIGLLKGSIGDLTFSKSLFAMPLVSLLTPIVLLTIGIKELDDIIFIYQIFISSLPTIVHVVVTITIISSKLLLPLAKPITEMILYAFYDSKKGVLSTLAIFFGALAKMTQIYMKTFH